MNVGVSNARRPGVQSLSYYLVDTMLSFSYNDIRYNIDFGETRLKGVELQYDNKPNYTEYSLRVRLAESNVITSVLVCAFDSIDLVGCISLDISIERKKNSYYIVSNLPMVRDEYKLGITYRSYSELFRVSLGGGTVSKMCTYFDFEVCDYILSDSGLVINTKGGYLVVRDSGIYINNPERVVCWYCEYNGFEYYMIIFDSTRGVSWRVIIKNRSLVYSDGLVLSVVGKRFL